MIFIELKINIFDHRFPPAAYLLLLLQHAEPDDLVTQDTNGNVSRYILSRRDFLTWAEWQHTDTQLQRLARPIDLDSLVQQAAYYDRMKCIIDRLDLRSTALDAPRGLNPILDHIYESGLYELTPEMIALSVRTKEKEELAENLSTANYSTIRTSGCTLLIDRVEEYRELY